ncbi:MAG: OsmC family protein [Planctomycetota bacterium]
MTSIEVSFPGGKRVSASVRGHRVETDQPAAASGDDSAPSPFELFLASLATCAGFYVLEFCRGRDLPVEGISLSQVCERDPESRRISAVKLSIRLPEGFPAKYRAAVAKAAEACAVRKAIEHPFAFEVSVKAG